jgi:O-antigen/teichoic acid export membrane protein
VWAASIVDAIVWSRAEIFFLQLFWGNESVGLFSIGLTVTNLAIQLPILITSGVLTRFAERFGRADIEGMHEAYASGTRLLAFVLFPAGLGAAAIMPVLLPAIFGSNFAAAVPSAMILVTIGCIGAASSVGANLVYALGRSHFIFRSGVLGARPDRRSGIC